MFRAWEASGALNAYRAHFLFDDVHWLWYAGFFTAVLGRLFERSGDRSRAASLYQEAAMAHEIACRRLPATHPAHRWLADRTKALARVQQPK